MDTLQRDAERSATWRGHRLGRWQSPDLGRSAFALCLNDGCTASATVDTRPPANGIDISGAAVAVNCPYLRTPFVRRALAGELPAKAVR